MHNRVSAWPLPLLVCLGAAARAAPAAVQPPALTVAQIVSKAPSLAGTSPAAPAWSPDGQVLAFTWNDRALPAREIWLVDRAGTAPRRLTSATGPAGAPEAVSELAWMRDGRSIAYLAGGDVYRIAAGGGPPARLTTSSGEKRGLAISPDGRSISFLSGGDLWLLPAAGGPEERLTHVGKKPLGVIPLGTYYRPEVEIGGAAWRENTS